jgi:hypothetical protein
LSAANIRDDALVTHDPKRSLTFADLKVSEGWNADIRPDFRML